jgi:hypothetical protein
MSRFIDFLKSIRGCFFTGGRWCVRPVGANLQSVVSDGRYLYVVDTYNNTIRKIQQPVPGAPPAWEPLGRLPHVSDIN